MPPHPAASGTALFEAMRFADAPQSVYLLGSGFEAGPLTLRVNGIPFPPEAFQVLDDAWLLLPGFPMTFLEGGAATLNLEVAVEGHADARLTCDPPALRSSLAQAREAEAGDGGQAWPQELLAQAFQAASAAGPDQPDASPAAAAGAWPELGGDDVAASALLPLSGAPAPSRQEAALSGYARFEGPVPGALGGVSPPGLGWAIALVPATPAPAWPGGEAGPGWQDPEDGEAAAGGEWPDRDEDEDPAEDSREDGGDEGLPSGPEGALAGELPGSRFLRHDSHPAKAQEVLQTWFKMHLRKPYPNDAVQELLAELAGVSQAQVKTWMTNARRRWWWQHPTDPNLNEWRSCRAKWAGKPKAGRSLAPAAAASERAVLAGAPSIDEPRRFNAQSTPVLLQWAVDHLDWPYPTVADKTALAHTAGISFDQVTHWFINYRSRNWTQDLNNPAVRGNPGASCFLHRKKERKPSTAPGRGRKRSADRAEPSEAGSESGPEEERQAKRRKP